jgi:predicted ATPase/DNA-binding SARP family transcriptional activator
VEGEAGPVALVGRKQRALLGLLLLHAGEVVSSDRLLDELWGERPPATAASSLRNLIAQLRSVLGPNAIVTREPGYLLVFEPQRLDRARFERLLAEARGAAPRERAMLLREALALWRGPPLSDLVFERFAQPEIQRLEELRLEALEERIEAELELGQGSELVAELEALVAEQPLRERLRGQLMQALYRSGRQAEALDAYQAARRMLVEELGVEPSPPLQELQGAILRQDPALAPAPWPAPTPKLPAQPTRFLGRTRELAEVVALLQRADLRLLTLTGAGGSGKTRLALEAARRVADDYRDGVFWVPLAGLRDAALVPASIAHALAITDERRLADSIGERRLLLLVDNCEHLLAAALALAELLSACPNIKLLATSREPLHVAGEREYQLPTLAEGEALELFRQRAHAAEPEQAVLAICRRLDCLPLAVELAAARTKLLPPEALLQRLEKRLPLLTGGPRDAPERQRTLEATIAWSYDLLGEGEKRLFARLSVFAGGSTLDAAEQVCNADLDTMQSLVEKNLLRRVGERFTMLETIREYAFEQLVGAETDQVMKVRDRLMRALGDYLVGLDVLPYPGTASLYSGHLPDEADNFRAAVSWALATRELDLALRLAIAARLAWTGGLRPVEQSRWLDAALAVGEDISRRTRAQAHHAVGGIAFMLGDFDKSVSASEESLRLFGELGDQSACVETLINVGNATQALGDEERARTAYEDALELAAQAPYVRGLYRALHAMGTQACESGDLVRAEQLLERSAGLAAEAGDGHLLAFIVVGLAKVALARNDLARATTLFGEGLQLACDWTMPMSIVYGLAGLAVVAASSGDTSRAGTLWGALEVIEYEAGLTARRRDPLYEQAISACAETAPAAFAAACERGRSMSRDDAVAYALHHRGGHIRPSTA